MMANFVHQVYSFTHSIETAVILATDFVRAMAQLSEFLMNREMLVIILAISVTTFVDLTTTIS